MVSGPISMNMWLLNVLVDLRFIPDEIDFEEDQIRVQRTTEKKDICNEKPINYTPPDFVSSALTRTKCDLTWDETDKRRTNLLRKSDLVEDQVQHLIASGSEAGFQITALSSDWVISDFIPLKNSKCLFFGFRRNKF